MFGRKVVREVAEMSFWLVFLFYKIAVLFWEGGGRVVLGCVSSGFVVV